MEKYLGVKIIEAEPMTMTKATEELQRPFLGGVYASWTNL
jgi:hypothetical protein